MSDFSLSYGELKKKAGIESNQPSDSTIHRWIQFGLIECEKEYKSLYSERSVEQLKLCMKLRIYGKAIDEMKRLFEGYPLETLSKKIGKITPNELNNMLQKATKKK